MSRVAGILMPITSLPGKYGIGCFSKEAYAFIDWLKGAGQTYWQILPIHPTSYGDSPYQCFSTFAGNPYFIDLEELIEEGMLTREECDSMDFGDDEMRKLSFGEIECITIIDRKVIAIDTKGNHYRIQDRLRALEEILPSYFIRINKSTLANEHRILRFDASFSGGVDAVFQCGVREYVSRRCFAEIRRRYEGG